MATTRPFRPGLHYLARVLCFVGFTGLFLAISLHDSHTMHPVLWWVLLAVMVVILGIVAQYCSAPIPLTPVRTTPAGWSLFFVAVIVVPLFLSGFDWQGPRMVLLVLIAAAFGAGASVFPVHRRAAIQQQYHKNAAASSNTGSPTDWPKHPPQT